MYIDDVDIDTDQEDDDLNESLSFYIEEEETPRSGYDDDDNTSVDTTASDDFKEMGSETHQRNMDSLNTPSHNRFEVDFFLDETETSFGTASWMTASTSSTTSTNTSTTTGTSSNATRKTFGGYSIKKTFPFTFHVIVPDRLWKLLQQQEPHRTLELFIRVNRSEYEYYKLTQPNVVDYPHIWKATIDVPRNEEFQYCYWVGSLQDDYCLFTEERNRSWASVKFEKYDIFAVDKKMVETLSLKSRNVLSLLGSSTRSSQKAIQQGQEPFSLFLHYLFLDWCRRERVTSKFHTETTLTHLMNSYESCKVCAGNWTKDISKYQLNSEDIARIIRQTLLRVMLPELRTFEDAVAACCILGSLPDRVRFSCDSGECVERILPLLVSPHGVCHKLEDDLPDITYMDWFQNGLQTLPVLALENKKIVEYYTWIGCAPHVQDSKDSFSRFNDRAEDLQRQLLESSFFEAIRFLRNKGGLSEALWPYPIILSRLIAAAPTLQALHDFLHSELEQLNYFSSISYTVARALVSKFKRMKGSSNLNTFEIREYFMGILKLHEEFKSIEMMIQLLQNPDVQSSGADLGLDIIRECCVDQRDFGSLRVVAFDAIRSWLFRAIRRNDQQQFKDCMAIVDQLLSLSAISDDYEALLDELMLQQYFVSLDDLTLLTNIASLDRQVSAKLDQYLLKRSIHITDIYIQENGITDDLLSVIKQFNSSKKADLLLHIYRSSEAEASFESFIQNPLWYHLLKHFRIENKNILPDHELNTILQQAEKECFRFAKSILTQDIPFKAAKLAVEYRDNTQRLVRVLGDFGFQEDTLDNLGLDLDNVCSLLDAGQSFFTIFCDDPSYFQTDDILSKIIQLRSTIDTETVKQVMEQVKVLLKTPTQDVLRWFYELRGSELFLSMWCENLKHGITLNELTMKFIPSIQEKWHRLYTYLDTWKITYHQIDESILKVISPDRYEEELWKLKQTHSGRVESLSGKDIENWVQAKVHDLKTIKLVGLIKNSLPSFMRLVEYFRDYFSIDILASSEYQKLKLLSEKKEHEWRSQITGKISIASEKSEIFDAFSTDLLDFVGILSNNKDLLDWLIAHRDNDDFKNLLDISKSDTDSVRILDSISSLVQVRTILSPLIGYSVKFDHLQSFNDVLCKLHVDSKTLAHMRTLQRNFSLLRRVFEQKTRSPGIQALHELKEIVSEGKYCLKANSASIVTCRLAKDIKSLDALVELRNKLLLVRIPEDSQLNSMQSNISNFVQQVTKLCLIRDVLHSLTNSGHFHYQNYKLEISAASNINYLKDVLDHLMQDKKHWEKLTRDLRYDCYFSNFFRVKQILTIIEMMNQYNSIYNTDPESAALVLQKLHSTLSHGNRSLDEDLVASAARSWINTSTLSLNQIIMNICSLLNHLFANRKLKHRHIAAIEGVNQFALDNEPLEERLARDHFCIIKCYSNTSVLDTIVSLYSRLQRLPEPEEILFGDEHVDFEDIVLILNRWFKAAKYERENTIYCIADIDKLSISVQYKIVDHLRRLLRLLERESNTINCSQLVLMNSSNKSPHLMTVLSKYIVDVRPLSLVTIKKVYLDISRRYSAGTVCYTSTVPGAGKTHHILKQIYADQLSQYSHIPLNQETTPDRLIASLSNETKGHALHLDVSPCCISTTDYEKVDTFLFKLIYIGVLRDRNKGSVYFKRKCDSLFVEIPSSIGGVVFKQLSTCHRIQIMQVQTDAKSFDLARYSRQKIGKTLVIATAYRGKVQFVCKYLKEFLDGRLITDEGREFNPEMQLDMSEAECYNIVTNCLKEQPSFSLFHAFIEFLHSQLKNVLEYRLLHNPAMDDIRDYVIRCIIQSGIGFATRSLPNIDNRKLAQDNILQLYSERFGAIRQWNDVSHPLAVFYTENRDIMGLNVTVKMLKSNRLARLMRENNIGLEDELEQIVATQDHARAQKLLRKVAGVSENHSSTEESTYVLTKDNLMKSLTIILKLQCNLPVVIIGETGIGKTELFKYIASALGVKWSRFILHAGTKRSEIVDWITPFIQNCKDKTKDDHTLIFFDQINSCNCMDLFKEILCDRLIDDQPIPDNLKIVASCTPYRLRNTNLSHHAANGLCPLSINQGSISTKPSDPLEALVYRVFTMPESLADHIFHFGALDERSEKQYIGSMFLVELSSDPLLAQATKELLQLFVDLIFASQRFIQRIYQELSAVSLRDVKRCIQLYKWFVDSKCKRNGISLESSNTKSIHIVQRNIIRSSMILSLAHCYYYRLSQERDQYRTCIEHWLKQTKSAREDDFLRILREEQKFYSDHISLPDSISMNDALRENISVMIVSILNNFPVFVVGKSGNSKSLAMEIISSNLNGKASRNEFLQSLPAVHVFSYQCSQFSKEEGLVEIFAAAKRHQKYASTDTVVVVLLNEVGLLEQSPFTPLKVLNKELEEPQVSVVGLSNLSLDPSTNNKVIFLSRPEPTTADLKNTLTGIVSSYRLSSTLHSLAKAYQDVYSSQSKPDFFGLRDFYSMIKFINARMTNSLTAQLLISAVHRNFGGRPADEFEYILRSFCNCLGFTFDSAALISPLQSVKDNLQDKSARNLMLLTKNNAALAILFDQQLLRHKTTEVIFGSDFPEDKDSEVHICMSIQKIKNCMAEGTTVVLVNCEDLYESLYDLFNMQYVSYDGLRYVSLALGTYSRQCLVHENFRVIVIVDEDHAYSNLVPPLLNRFEKQVLQRSHLLHNNSNHLMLLKSIETWCSNVCKSERHLMFPGYHRDALSSLVLSVYSRLKSKDYSINDLLQEATSTLLWIASADGVIRSARHSGQSLLTTYFDVQEHRNLPEFINFVISREGVKAGWMHPQYNAFQVCVSTYSTTTVDIREMLQGKELDPLVILQLHQIESEFILSQSFESFFSDNSESSLLVLQCDTSAISFQRILHAQYICENKRSLASSNTGKHVIFLIHLQACTQNSEFAIDFDTPWRYVFIDEIQALQPTLDVIIRRSLEDHVNHLNLRDIITNNFRTSLSLLRYPEQTSDDRMAQTSQITEKIKLVSKLLENVQFWSCAEPKLLHILKINFANSDSMMWSEYVAQHYKKYFLRSGNFYSAITFCITKMVIVSFAYLLADLDRNNNLKIFFNDPTASRLWLSLWTDSDTIQFICAQDDHSESTVHKMEFLEKNVVNVRSDGTNPFDAKFPFSYLVARTIHSLRSVYESSRKKKGNLNSFAKHVQITLPTLEGIQLSREYLLNYIHDYICIYGTYGPAVSVSQQFEIVRKMLDSVQINSIADVQQFYWGQERRLQDYFKIFEVFPSVVPQFIEKLRSYNVEIPIEKIDIALCKVIYRVIDPCRYSITPFAKDAREAKKVKEDKKIEWLKIVTSIIAPVEDLLLLIHSSDVSIETIRDTWTKILLYRETLIHITIPMRLIPEIPLSFWQKLRANRADRRFSSLETVYEVINFLKLVNNLVKLMKSKEENLMKIKFKRFFEMFLRDYFLEYLDPDYIPDNLLDFLIKICRNRLNDLVVDIDLGPSQQLRCLILQKLCSNRIYSHKVRNYVKQLAIKEWKTISNLSESILYIYMLGCEDVIQRHLSVSEESIDKLLPKVDAELLDSNMWDVNNILDNAFHICALRVAIVRYINNLVAVAESERDLTTSPITEKIKQVLSEPEFQFMREIIVRQVAKTKGLTFLLRNFAKNESIGKELPWLSAFIEDRGLIERAIQRVLVLKLSGFHIVASRVQQLIQNPTDPFAQRSLTNDMETARKYGYNAFKKLAFLALFDQKYVQNQVSRARPEIFERYVLGKIFDSEVERTVVKKFANNDFNPQSYLKISKHTSMKDLSLLYVIGHIVATAIGNCDYDRSLWYLLFDCSKLESAYLPTMVDDMRKYVVSSGMHGNFVQCPNGHYYLVDLCGKPMEKGYCVVCNAPIGGSDHEFSANNRLAPNTDNSPIGYAVLDLKHESDIHSSVRSLSPVTFRLIRIIIHSLLFVSSNISEAHHSKIRGLTHYSGAHPDDLSSFFLSHLQNDWKILNQIIGYNEEKTSILVFYILELFTFTLREKAQKRKTNELKTQKPDLLTQSGFNWFAANTPKFKGRDIWEILFQDCVSSVLSNANQKFHQYYEALDSKNEFVLSLKNQKSGVVFPISSPQSQLWFFTANVNDQNFQSHFLSKEKNAQQYPLLNLFIKNEKILYATRYIPHVIKWQSIMCAHLSRKIDQLTARSRTVRDIINQFPQREQRELQKIFEGYAEAFNLCMPHIDNYNCTQIPKICKKFRMTLDSAILYCIPAEKDESICSLALIQYLVSAHNNMIEKVNAEIETSFRNKKQIKESTIHLPPTEISSRFVLKHHLIVYDKEKELMPEVQAALIQSPDGEASYDFERIEQFVVNRYLFGKPKVKLVVETFEYLGDRRFSVDLTSSLSTSGNHEKHRETTVITGNATELHKKIPQVEIPTDIKQSIFSELMSDHSSEHTTKASSGNAPSVYTISPMHLCMIQVEEVISFLMVSISSTRSEQSRLDLQQMKIERYMKDILLIDPSKSDLLRSKSIAKHIQLKHLSSLWTLFESKITSNPLSHVSQRYKDKLDNDERQALQNIQLNIEVILLAESLKNLMLEYMYEDVISPQEPLKKVLGHIRVLIKRSKASPSPTTPIPQVSPPSSPMHKRAFSLFDDNQATSSAKPTTTTADEQHLSPQTEEMELGEVMWFKQYFPESILTSKTYETYKLLSEFTSNIKVTSK